MILSVSFGKKFRQLKKQEPIIRQDVNKPSGQSVFKEKIKRIKLSSLSGHTLQTVSLYWLH